MSKLQLNSVVKMFGATTVLQGITTEFFSGTVTSIVGDNGAGKTTLCKTIAGVYHPTSGNLKLDDLQLTHLGPHETREAGIEMIYQDLALAKQHDIVSNLFLGREKTRWLGWLDRKAMLEQGQNVLDTMGIKLPNLRSAVGVLSGGSQSAIGL
jgi:ABC-type sugar transport system ATPase subunit